MLTLRSSAFEPDQPIPARHTCDGDDLSPPLEWSGAPAGTQSFALIVDDPDAPDPAAPKRTWIHWVRYGMPAERDGLPEGAGNRPPPDGESEALTDSDRRGYGGPCPPIGRHRYFFRLFALDVDRLDLPGRFTAGDVFRAMHGHVLAEASVHGSYSLHPDNAADA